MIPYEGTRICSMFVQRYLSYVPESTAELACPASPGRCVYDASKTVTKRGQATRSAVVSHSSQFTKKS